MMDENTNMTQVKEQLQDNKRILSFNPDTTCVEFQNLYKSGFNFYQIKALLDLIVAINTSEFHDETDINE